MRVKNRISQTVLKSTIAIAMVVAAPASLLADLISLTSPGDVPSPSTTRSFDGIGTGPLTDEFLFYDDGAATGFRLPGAPDGGLALVEGGVAGDVFVDVFSAPGFASIYIVFNAPMSAVGVDYVRGPETPELEFEAYGAGDEFLGMVTSTGLSGFFGLQSDVGAAEIYSVIVHDSSFGFTLNNLIYGPSHVPVPGAILLGAIGLSTVAWIKRRFL